MANNTPGAVGLTTGANTPGASPNVLIYNPPLGGTPHVTLFNNGGAPALIGGSSVTGRTGLFFPPGAQLTLPYAPFAIYGVTGNFVVGTVTTTLTIGAAAGGTVLAVAGTASLTPGTLLRIGNNTFPSVHENVIVAAAPNSGSVTTTTPLQFDHLTGGTVAVLSSQMGFSISVNAGAT